MGEAREREKLGLAPRIRKPGEQIRVDLKNATPKVWECGEDALMAVKQLKDTKEMPDLKTFDGSYLLGFPVYRVPEKSELSLKFVFKDGHEKIIDFGHE